MLHLEDYFCVFSQYLNPKWQTYTPVLEDLASSYFLWFLVTDEIYDSWLHNRVEDLPKFIGEVVSNFIWLSIFLVITDILRD